MCMQLISGLSWEHKNSTPLVKCIQQNWELLYLLWHWSIALLRILFSSAGWAGLEKLYFCMCIRWEHCDCLMVWAMSCLRNQTLRQKKTILSCSKIWDRVHACSNLVGRQFHLFLFIIMQRNLTLWSNPWAFGLLDHHSSTFFRLYNVINDLSN